MLISLISVGGGGWYFAFSLFLSLINFSYLEKISILFILHDSLLTLSVDRNDAGLAAAELALAVEKHVLESGSIDTVGTVGIFLGHASMNYLTWLTQDF